MTFINDHRRWHTIGVFDLETGSWIGAEFAIDPEMVESATAFIAMNDVPGAICRQIDPATGAARLVTMVGEPVEH